MKYIRTAFNWVRTHKVGWFLVAVALIIAVGTIANLIG